MPLSSGNGIVIITHRQNRLRGTSVLTRNSPHVSPEITFAAHEVSWCPTISRVQWRSWACTAPKSNELCFQQWWNSNFTVHGTSKEHCWPLSCSHPFNGAGLPGHHRARRFTYCSASAKGKKNLQTLLGDILCLTAGKHPSFSLQNKMPRALLKHPQLISSAVNNKEARTQHLTNIYNTKIIHKNSFIKSPW